MVENLDKIEGQYIEVIKQNEGSSKAEIARKLGHCKSRTFYRLRELEWRGLIRVEHGKKCAKVYSVSQPAPVQCEPSARPGDDANP